MKDIDFSELEKLRTMLDSDCVEAIAKSPARFAAMYSGNPANFIPASGHPDALTDAAGDRRFMVVGTSASDGATNWIRDKFVGSVLDVAHQRIFIADGDTALSASMLSAAFAALGKDPEPVTAAELAEIMRPRMMPLVGPSFDPPGPMNRKQRRVAAARARKKR